MRNAGLEETQAGIKIAGRNINNLRYADDTNLIAENEEELKSLLMKVKVESEKVGSAFFTVLLSYPYMTTGKTIALTRRTFVGKVMFLLFNMLSRLVITFLSRSKWSFYFIAAITICSDFGAQKNKVSHCFYCFPIYLP